MTIFTINNPVAECGENLIFLMADGTFSVHSPDGGWSAGGLDWDEALIEAGMVPCDDNTPVPKKPFQLLAKRYPRER